jgi:hypothetical protein
MTTPVPTPTCCGVSMVAYDGIYECMLRSHHPRYASPALVELLSAAYAAGLSGEPLADFLARRELHTRLDAEGYVVRP